LPLGDNSLSLIAASDMLLDGTSNIRTRDTDTGFKETVRSNPRVAPFVGWALFRRAEVCISRGEADAALTNLKAILELPHLPAELVAHVHFERAVLHAGAGRHEAAIEDYSAVVKRKGAPTEGVARALFNRAILRNEKEGKWQVAIADLTSILNLRGAPPDLASQALGARGLVRAARGDLEGAATDYSAALAHSGIAAEMAVEILGARADSYAKRDDWHSAIVDMNSIIESPNLNDTDRAKALVLRATYKVGAGWTGHALDDLQAVLQSAPPGDAMPVAQELRDKILKALGTHADAVNKYTTVIARPGIGADELFAGRLRRGGQFAQMARVAAARADFSVVATREEAPPALRSQAILALAELCEDHERAIAALTKLAMIPGIPPDIADLALAHKSLRLAKLGDVERLPKPANCSATRCNSVSTLKRELSENQIQ
jgi:hypothetical protein